MDVFWPQRAPFFSSRSADSSFPGSPSRSAPSFRLPRQRSDKDARRPCEDLQGLEMRFRPQRSAGGISQLPAPQHTSHRGTRRRLLAAAVSSQPLRHGHGISALSEDRECCHDARRQGAAGCDEQVHASGAQPNLRPLAPGPHSDSLRRGGDRGKPRDGERRSSQVTCIVIFTGAPALRPDMICSGDLRC